MKIGYELEKWTLELRLETVTYIATTETVTYIITIEIVIHDVNSHTGYVCTCA